MNIAIKNYIKLLKIYFSYNSGRTICGYMPLRIWLEPTDRCNLSCPLCINRLMPPEQKGDMNWDLYKKIIDQLSGEICDINLFHRGEPLLHPKIADMVSYAKNKDLTARIHTNASLLTKEVSESLIRNGLDYISFSFDGFDKNIYEKNRAGAKFETTLKNITDFLKAKKRLESKKPYTVLQIIRDSSQSEKDFHAKKSEFLKQFNKLPLDKISVRTPHNWGGGINPNKIVKKPGLLSCTFPWYGLTIFNNGKVVLCCQDYEGAIPLGDANKNELKDIWNSIKMQNIRSDFSKKQYKSYLPCPNCDRIKRNTIFGIPAEYIGTFFREAKIRK